MAAKKPASPSSAPDPDAIKTFKELFWNARKAHRMARKQAVFEDPAHQSALSIAQEHVWPWAHTLLNALLLAYRNDNQQALKSLVDLEIPDAFAGELHFVQGVAYHGLNNWDDALECYGKAIESQNFGAPGYAWHNIGLIYGEKKEFDAALAHYRKALKSPDFDTPGDAWYSMGFAYGEKKEFDAARHCYREAIESPDFDTPGDAWYCMGVDHVQTKDFEASLECNRKALDCPDFRMAGSAWHNMGFAHKEMKEFDAALGCYRKALDSADNDSPQLTRLNLANLLRECGRLEEAKEEIQKVLSGDDAEGQHERAHFLLSVIESSERGFEPDPDEEALAAPSPPSLEDGPEGRMKKALRNRSTRYEEYLAKFDRPAPDGLSILRGWSSSVTLLEGAQDCQWSGGGYFLKWLGQGLVIDPGFDFLDNFHQAGLCVTDISVVAVSHNHPDHNADLNTLDDLCYEIAKVVTPTPKFLFAMDEDTAIHFKDEPREHRRSPFKFTRFDQEEKRWLVGVGLPFIIEHFPVKHGDEVPRAIGMRIRLLAEDGSTSLTIGYTGDGEYTPDLSKQLQGVDLLIAHVSQPDAEEFNDPTHLKEIHLGYNGAIRLIQEVQPKLTLIGEFWAGLADLRLDLISGIRLRSGKNAVLPACLGLGLSLPDLKIRCSQCKKRFPAEKIRITPPLREFGLLGYLCTDCIV
ncbi:MAG: MBL fold metallo-hydrolase [Verrucomicrobiota bacterium]